MQNLKVQFRIENVDIPQRTKPFVFFIWLTKDSFISTTEIRNRFDSIHSSNNLAYNRIFLLETSNKCQWISFSFVVNECTRRNLNPGLNLLDLPPFLSVSVSWEQYSACTTLVIAAFGLMRHSLGQWRANIQFTRSSSGLPTILIHHFITFS